MKPMLCNTQTVRNILAGIKTQDRRIYKGPDPTNCRFLDGRFYEHKGYPLGHALVPNPLGEPGDIIYVRETWTLCCKEVVYRASIDGASAHYGHEKKWRPSIHMPKSIARIFLKVKRVWVERIQDISEEDALAEGIECKCHTGRSEYDCCCLDEIDHFIILWNSIYPGSWERNDWVWCTEFEKIERK